MLISPQMRCVPYLLRMTWKGYPLHYHKTLGWGFLVPTDSKKPTPALNDSTYEGYPMISLYIAHTFYRDFIDEDSLYLSDKYSGNDALYKVQGKHQPTHMGVSDDIVSVANKKYFFIKVPHKVSILVQWLYYVGSTGWTHCKVWQPSL